jgi:anthranilate synthase component 1
MIYPSEKDFLKLAKKGNLIPVYKEILADTETPVSAYFKIAAGSRYSFLLESVEGEEKVARFSFLARDPEIIFEAKGGKAKITRFSEESTNIRDMELSRAFGPMDALRDIMKPFKFVPVEGIPPFCGGMVGYFGYDTVRFFERLPDLNKDDLKLPDMLLVLAKNIILFDHRQHKIKLISCVYTGREGSNEAVSKAYRTAVKKINKQAEELEQPLVLPKKKITRSGMPKAVSNFTRDEYLQAVRKAKKEIHAGEIIQVVPSQRFKVKFSGDPFYIYRALRSMNPSPYMYYLNFNGIHIAGSSPELLVRCENGIVETRPIAGTRPRGRDDKQDRELMDDLLRDPKEKAEHIMLVDLGRNDLGRVCETGTVKVTDFMTIEKYSHVMHIVSNVRGQLAKNKDSLDVLSAAFPAGTLTGAPKIRAMEIIEGLESVKRGPYGGCIGYLGFTGNLDTCITIRTVVVNKGTAYVQAGGGVVADSDPATEYQETLNKAKAQLHAIELAYKQFE